MTLDWYENQSLKDYRVELYKKFPGINGPYADIHIRSEQVAAIEEKVSERRNDMEKAKLKRIANYKAQL